MVVEALTPFEGVRGIAAYAAAAELATGRAGIVLGATGVGWVPTLEGTLACGGKLLRGVREEISTGRLLSGGNGFEDVRVGGVALNGVAAELTTGRADTALTVAPAPLVVGLALDIALA